MNDVQKLKRLITDIRESHPDMVKLFTEGQCFNFACILRGQLPGGSFWYDAVPGHMYYKYKGRYYDIRGNALCGPCVVPTLLL